MIVSTGSCVQAIACKKWNDVRFCVKNDFFGHSWSDLPLFFTRNCVIRDIREQKIATHVKPYRIIYYDMFWRCRGHWTEPVPHIQRVAPHPRPHPHPAQVVWFHKMLCSYVSHDMLFWGIESLSSIIVVFLFFQSSRSTGWLPTACRHHGPGPSQAGGV